MFDAIKHIPNGAAILVDWLGDGAFPVESEIAQRRADICLNCPNNADGNPLVEAVANHIKTTVELKNGLKLRVNGEKSLKTCSVCECKLSLKIWTPLKHILKHTPQTELDKFPAHCWIHAESK